MEEKFKAFRVEFDGKNNYIHSIKERSIEDLPAGDILIKVKYSSVNYKDALSAIGNRGVTKEYPHTPGIDAAGVVIKSKDIRFNSGDSVIVTGHDLGMNTDGGFAQFISVPADWPILLPENLSLRESMIYGTAGFTAALSIKKLRMNGIKPSDGEILVTGATGGVASTALSILNKLGYTVVAATGKIEKKNYLKEIGADIVINREKINDESNKLLMSSKYIGVIDTVGGNTLATALKMIDYDGVATCCGNIRGDTFNSSIYPFILRGIHLIGIYSAECPYNLRSQIWSHLADDWKIPINNERINEISLDELKTTIESLLDGTHIGRTILKL